jgi:hypothetical protein
MEESGGNNAAMRMIQDICNKRLELPSRSTANTVPKIWQIFVGKEEEVPCRKNFPVILGK